MSEINYMDIAKFQEEGYLQEVNRRFFHPLGLALEIEQDVLGNWKLGGIWDYRESEEGMLFAPAITKHEKFKSRAERFDELFKEKLMARYFLLGYGIQEPVNGDDLNV